MPTVFLVHWDEEEGKEKASVLRKAGYIVAFRILDMEVFRGLRERPPDAFVIDLARRPSHGREVGEALRRYKTTRAIPLIFVGGEKEQVDKIKESLPDAAFTSWGRISGIVKKALAEAPHDPVVPPSVMAAYTDTPLVKKLGIKPNSTLCLINAPDHMPSLIGSLPEKVRVTTRTPSKADLMIWFVSKEKDFHKRLKPLSARLSDKGGLWVAWPKKTSGVPSDLTQNSIRQKGLASGLVDYKICAIDDVWSGLLFTRKKK